MYVFRKPLATLILQNLLHSNIIQKNCTKNSCIQFKSDVKNVISKSVRPYWKTEVSLYEPDIGYTLTAFNKN